MRADALLPRARDRLLARAARREGEARRRRRRGCSGIRPSASSARSGARGSSGSRRTGASRSTWPRSTSSPSPASSSSRGRSPCSPSRSSPTTRSRRWSSSATSATACRGTSCSRCSRRVALERLWTAVAHAMKVVHVHRMRGIGGSERHLLTLLPALRGRGVDARFVGLDDLDGWDPQPFYDELDRLRGAVRATSARRVRLAPRARPRRTSCTRTSSTQTCSARSSAADARSSRRSTTTTRSAPARSASSSGRSPAERRG